MGDPGGEPAFAASRWWWWDWWPEVGGGSRRWAAIPRDAEVQAPTSHRYAWLRRLSLPDRNGLLLCLW